MGSDPASPLRLDEGDSVSPLIGVVGTCGSGKSTLIAGLAKHGYRCRHIAQEHSYVKYMWQVITKPDILVFLESSFENSTSRRRLNWQPSDHEEQQKRLSHAREHAQLIIDTNFMSAEAVLARALDYLKNNAR
jgi:ATPase subunit of ABC transporter with duplicated ATPase domains